DVMVERAQETFGRFRAGEVRDFHHEMMHLALDVVLATLFGSDAGRAQGIGALLDSATADYRRLGMTFRGAFPRWFPFWSRLRYHWAGWRLRRIVERLVRGRQEKPLTNDMLSRLLEARDEGGVGMTQRQLIDECLTVMLAGHETTALALAYAFDRLARAPEIEARLRQEIQEVVGSRPARLSDIAQLPYTKAVVKETLRIYPPVWAVGRVAERSFSLAGATIQPGMVLVAVPWVVHHDERYYPEPDTFRPERFLNGAAEQLPKGAYLPFGAGPRTCIGNHFAELEMQLVLVTALQRYRFELVDAAPLRLSPSVTLRPAGPIRLRLASV
ncbi:MAG TPA: cytochrome P450, partial [Polyangiaceae bacterium]|nr:cytochrome P450 [Polyangiaceae bacterium]